MGQALVRCLNLYAGTGTGLLGNFIISLVIFGIWGVGWYSLLEFILDDDMIEKYQDGLSSISFVVSVVYYRWLNSLFEGYNNEPVALRSTLLAISNLSSLLFTFVSGHQSIPSNNNNKVSDRESHSLIMNEVGVSYHLFDALLFFSFRLYIDHDDKHYQSDDFIKGVDSERAKVRVLSECLAKNMTTLHLIGALSEAEQATLFQMLQPLLQKFISADINLEVKEEPFIVNHMLLILSVYFFFVVPFAMYVQLGSVMAISYPILMVLFTGPYIIRSWLGNPLEKYNPFGTKRYFQWRINIRSLLQQQYETSFGKKK